MLTRGNRRSLHFYFPIYVSSCFSSNIHSEFLNEGFNLIQNLSPHDLKHALNNLPIKLLLHKPFEKKNISSNVQEGIYRHIEKLQKDNMKQNIQLHKTLSIHLQSINKLHHMFKMQQSDLIGVPSLDPKKMTTEEREEYERDWLGYYRRHSKARTEAFKRMIKRKSQEQRLQRERKAREMDEMKREKERQQEIGYQLKQLAFKVYKYFSGGQQQTQPPSKEQGEKQLHITKQNRNLDEEEQHLLKKEQ